MGLGDQSTEICFASQVEGDRGNCTSNVWAYLGCAIAPASASSRVAEMGVAIAVLVLHVELAVPELGLGQRKKGRSLRNICTPPSRVRHSFLGWVVDGTKHGVDAESV
jgi:hypothetical protein